MNKLKRLFSPSTLATVAATGMLLHASVSIMAGSYYEVSAARMGEGTPCNQYESTCEQYPYYWCCPPGKCVPNSLHWSESGPGWAGYCYY